MAPCAWAKECEKPQCLKQAGGDTVCRHGFAELLRRVREQNDGS